MSEILNSVSNVEKELSTLDGILNHIYIFVKENSEFIVRLKIGDSPDFDPSLIAGLICTIEEMVGENTERILRYISLEKIKFVFIDYEQFVLAIGCDPDYPSSQFEKFMEMFEKSFDVSYNIQNYGKSPDGASLAMQIMKSLISEEFNIELILSDKSNIFPYKLVESANEIIDDELKKASVATVSKGDEEGETIVSPIPEMDPKSPLTQGLNNILERFSSTFSDIISVTMINFNESGDLEKITKGILSKTLEVSILNIILGMIDIVSNILEQDESSRTIDLGGDNWIFFQQVSHSGFLYVIVDNPDALKMVIPLVERVSKSVNEILPSNI